MNRTSDDEREQTYWITGRDQIICLASAVRSDIVDHLAAAEPLSVKQLAAQLGKRPSALYHHLDQLIAVDLVREVGARVRRKKSEKLYQTPSRRMRLIRALGDPANRDDMIEMVAANSRRAKADFAKALGRPDAKVAGTGRNLGFYRMMTRPSKATLEKVNAHLDEIAELLWESQDEKEPLVSLSWIISPTGSDN